MQLFREIGYPAKFRSYLFPEFGFNPSFWYLFRVSGCYFFQKLALQRISGHIYSQNLVLHQAQKPFSRNNSNYFEILCSRPTKNHPLVYPKIDLPGREKTKPLSLFIAAILQLSLLYSTFNFPIQWVSAFVSASKPLLPLFHSAIPSKPYKPSLFPVFLIVFWIVKGA